MEDQAALVAAKGPNIGIVTAYNDMLSAHQPYGRYPDRLKIYAREVGATAQVAGGTPAMCDGVTQGETGMELSLFSRDVIALSTALALSHGMYDGALMLGICDKIVPGMLIGSLRFGHLPTIFVPSGPMPSGIPNKEKQRLRQLYAEGKATRAELLARAVAAAAAGGRGAVGPSDVAQALNEGRVATLLIADGLQVSGCVTDDGALTAATDDEPTPAGERDDRFAERLIERAVGTSAEVVTIGGGDPNAPPGGVAAILRW
jgi:hypothetical protein